MFFFLFSVDSMNIYWLYIFLGATVVSARRPSSTKDINANNSKNQDCGVVNAILNDCPTSSTTSSTNTFSSTSTNVLASSTSSPSNNSVNIGVLAAVIVPVVFIVGAILFLSIQVYPSWRKKRQGHQQKPVESGWEDYNFKSDQFNESDFQSPIQKVDTDSESIRTTISSKTALKNLPPLPHPSMMEPRWRINGDMNEKYEINEEEKCEVESHETKRRASSRINWF